MQKITLRRLGFGVGFVIVAGVAAANSFEHMHDVALIGHQSEVMARTLPLSIDGLMLIASLAIAEDKAQHRYPRGWARFGFWFAAIISVTANIAATAVHYGDPVSIAVSAWPPVGLLIAVEIVGRHGRPRIERSMIEPAIIEVPAPDTMAALDEPSALPSAPVSPAVSGQPVRRNRPSTYSERHERRLRRGK